jgi:hypothetical protein
VIQLHLGIWHGSMKRKEDSSYPLLHGARGR